MADEATTTPTTEETSAGTPDAATPAATPANPEDALGDAGKRALQALRQEVKDLRAELKRYKASEPTDDGERDAADADGSTSESTRDAAPTSDASPSATEGNDVEPTTSQRPRFQGTGDGGAFGRSAGGFRQLTRDDLKRMSPAAIDRARRNGQLRDLLSGK